MINLLTSVWVICAVVPGVLGWSWWWIAPLAACGVGLYFLDRPDMFFAFAKRGQLTMALLGHLAVQAILPSLLFGAGRLVGLIG